MLYGIKERIKLDDKRLIRKNDYKKEQQPDFTDALLERCFNATFAN